VILKNLVRYNIHIYLKHIKFERKIITKLFNFNFFPIPYHIFSPVDGDKIVIVIGETLGVLCGERILMRLRGKIYRSVARPTAICYMVQSVWRLTGEWNTVRVK